MNEPTFINYEYDNGVRIGFDVGKIIESETLHILDGLKRMSDHALTRKLADSGFIQMPRDAVGIAIFPGDTVASDDFVTEQKHVKEIIFCEDGSATLRCDGGYTRNLRKGNDSRLRVVKGSVLKPLETRFKFHD